MDILNLPNCGGVTGTFNSGVNICDIIKDIPFGLLLMDAGVEFSAADRADVETFVAAIKTKTRAARGGRVYPLWDLVNYEDATKEATRGQVGNLSTSDIKLVDAVPGFKFGHYKGELFHQKLSRAERETLRLMIIDQNFAVYGTKKAGGGMTGYSLNEFSVDPSKFATPAGAAQYPFNVVLASLLEYKDNMAFVQTDSTLGNISGLNDVNLTLFNLTSNVAKIKILTDGDQQDLFDLYDSELAAVGAWTLINKQTGAAITITSVAATDTVNKVWTVTIDSTAWTALASLDKVLLNLAAASVLSATYLVDGYESAGALEIEKP